jgi:predicted Zn-dependent peptidase
MKGSNFYRKKLDNGITVIFEERKLPVVTISSSVKYGSQFESEKFKGISHFMEHLVFKGTKNRKVEEIPQEIESKGGIINAFTSEEVTSYWNKLPSKYLSLGADISRDLIVNPLFEEVSLERERKVILEEIKMYHDNPSTHVLEKVKELLYKKPFNLSIAGTQETVSNLKREDIIKLHKKSYTSNNIIFCVIGKANWEDVLKEAKKFPNTTSQIKNIPIAKRFGESIEKRKGIDQAHLVLGYHSPTLVDNQRYASEVMDSILGGGMSSRLFQEIREKRGLCYSIRSNLEQSRDYAYSMIYAGTTKDSVKLVKDLTLKEIKKIGDLKKSDLEEAKERLIGLRQIGKEKSESTMVELLQEEIGGDANNYYDYEEKISQVKLEEVKKSSRLKGYSFTALVPE